MVNSQKSFNFSDYFDIFLKRKWYFIFPFTLVAACTVFYLLVSPKWYRSSTLILVSAQRIPTDYVKPTVTSGIDERLISISQEILSRTRLEQIISEFKLYPDRVKTQPMESLVVGMRKDIKIDFPKGEKEKNHFTISYEGKDPQLVASVTGRLAALFVEENMKIREQQAKGTTQFLEDEVKDKRQKVEDLQKDITNFKKRFISELPENREANLKVLEQLNFQSQKINELIKAAEDRKVVIQNQMTTMTFKGLEAGQEGGRSLSNGPRPPTMVQLSQLKGQLEELQAKYTENHPDIRITKKKIADLEKKMAESLAPEGGKEAGKKEKTGDPVQDQYNIYQIERKTQLSQIDREINRLKKEDERTRVMIAQYQGRVENTPIRELALSTLTREFNNVNETFQVLLKKNSEAKQAENLERRQQGEQFRIVDPARVPQRPFKPDIGKALLIGLVLGLGSGFAVTLIREQLDRSFRDGEDLEVTLGLRVLANIPKAEKEAA
jgi:polysaccharide chain length determinant protein (PEP-CTERM system associated)